MCRLGVVVPARAGMSPAELERRYGLPSGPRASGDEPDTVRLLELLEEWSPRERG